MAHTKGSRISDDRELALYDKIACEPAEATGQRAEFYPLRKAVNYDPVLGENYEKMQMGPYELMVALTDYAENSTTDSDEGTTTEREITFWMCRKHAEDVGAPEPEKGDVIAIFMKRLPEPWWFDIVHVERKGYLPGSATFVQWEMRGMRRTEYVPERKEGIR